MNKPLEKENNVIPLQRPAPLPQQHPFSTPSPEDALIEMIDLNKKETGDER